MNVYDIETFEENSIVVPYCICFIINNKSFKLYYDIKKNLIISSIENICENSNLFLTEIYVHNLNFDALIIINELTKNMIKYQIMARETNIYVLDVFYLNKIIRFRCSFKILPLSLRKIGEIENFSKTYFPYKFVTRENLFYIGTIPEKKYWNENDYDIYKKQKKNDYFNLQEESINYCFNDVFLTQKFLTKLIPIIENEYKGIVKKSFSSASISHKIFFHKYNNNNIQKNILLKDDVFIRKAYFGGRCEVFGNIYDNEYVKYFDFSGMYGQCMAEKFHKGEGYYAINSNINLPGFHTIIYESKDFNLPILPYHSETGKLIFSNGKKIGTFWFEEIQLFCSQGGKVLEVLNSYIYNDYGEVFNFFVKNFNEIKNKGGYYKIFGKLVINSLYGSFALNADNNYTYITFSDEEFESISRLMTVKSSIKINSSFIIIIENDYKSKKFLEKNNKKTEIGLRNVSYAAAISSKARIKLYKAFESVIQDGGRILYCDTDSIFAAYDVNDLRQNTLDYNIAWEDYYSDAVFIAPKTYALKNDKTIIKIKGVGIKNTFFETIKENFYSGTSMKFENQLNFKRRNFDLRQEYNAKNISFSNYDKRIFIDNKKKTLPFINNTLI